MNRRNRAPSDDLEASRRKTALALRVLLGCMIVLITAEIITAILAQ